MDRSQPTSSWPDDAGDSLTSASPAISEREAERLVAEHYGTAVTARAAAAERDDNFRVETTSGRAYFLKIAHASEPPEVTNLSTSALLHVAETAPQIPIQRVVGTLAGEPETRVAVSDGSARTLRLTTYLDGRTLQSVPLNPESRRNLGRTLAALNLALRSFVHPSADRELLWDLQHAARLRPLLDETEVSGDRDLLAGCLERYESVVRPALTGLRKQVVHNDLSGDNVLVSADGAEVTGIIDFGDVVQTALVNDVATAAAYQLRDDPSLTSGAVDVVGGYHEVDPLTRQELELVYDLVRTRIVARIVITEWRARRFPENRSYIMRNTPRAWWQLERLPLSDRAAVTETLIERCGPG